MADGARSLPASAAKVARARREGDVPHSAVVTGGAVVLMGVGLAGAGAAGALSSLLSLFRRALARALAPLPFDPYAAVREALAVTLSWLGPWLALVFGTAVLVSVLQTRLAARTSWKRPARGLGPGVFAPFVSGALLFVGGVWLWGARAQLVSLGRFGVSLTKRVVVAGALTMDLIGRLGLSLAALAVADAVWQWWLWSRRLRMSHREQRDERRFDEGDPLVRRERQRLHRDEGSPRAP
ncbi:MAG: EscU/YscU/HrcU family type III secretion system export apparatus switch protein [Myxococcales bacterium]|nr:EscU/YscU/HrcU family type III secretion system export apparatus switch protein [Myxococcales bacterium]